MNAPPPGTKLLTARPTGGLGVAIPKVVDLAPQQGGRVVRFPATREDYVIVATGFSFKPK